MLIAEINWNFLSGLMSIIETKLEKFELSTTNQPSRQTDRHYSEEISHFNTIVDRLLVLDIYLLEARTKDRCNTIKSYMEILST